MSPNLPDLRFSAEPAMWVALADAVLVLAVLFGLPITVEQKAAILAVVVAASGVLIRSRVSPV